MTRVLPIFCVLATFGLGWLLTPPSEDEPSDRQSLSSRKLRLQVNDSSRGSQKRVAAISRLGTYEEQFRQVIALASSIPVDEIAQWHRSNLIDALDSDLETLFFRITSERWLAANPEEFMKWAFKMNYSQMNLHFAQWATKDPEGVGVFLSELPRSSRSYYVSRFMSELAKTRPDLALALVEEHQLLMSSHGSNDYHLKSILNVLAREDLDGLLAAQGAWPEKMQGHAASAISGVLMKDDFAKGMAFMRSEGLGWKSLTSAMAPKLAASLIENRQQLPDGWLSNLFGSSGHYFAIAENGLELWESGPGHFPGNAGSMAYFASLVGRVPMTGDRPERLMAIINGDSFSLENRMTMLRSKVAEWNGNDVAGVRDWLSLVTDPVLQLAAKEELESLERSRDTKPTPEQDLIKAVRGEGSSYAFIKTINGWSPEETGRAVEVFRDLPTGDQQAAFDSVLILLNNAPRNFDYLKVVFNEAAEFPTAETKDRVMMKPILYQEFAKQFAAKEPAQAAKWAEGLPAGSLRSEAIQGVLASWKYYSQSEAEAWLKTLPASDRVALEAAKAD